MTIAKQKATNSNDIMWTIDIETAKTVRAMLKKENHTKGSWVYFNVIQPINAATRKKADSVKLYSSGFSNAEIAQILDRANVGYIY